MDERPHVEKGGLDLVLDTAALVEERRRAMDAGMDDYLAKPVKPEALRDVLLRYLAPPSLAASEAGCVMAK